MDDLDVIIQKEQDLAPGKLCTGIVVARIIEIILAVNDTDAGVLFQFRIEGCCLGFTALVIHNDDLIIGITRSFAQGLQHARQDFTVVACQHDDRDQVVICLPGQMQKAWIAQFNLNPTYSSFF